MTTTYTTADVQRMDPIVYALNRQAHTDAQKVSASYLNTLSIDIQDNANDQGWALAQPHLLVAHDAHRAGSFNQARMYMDNAHRAAFGDTRPAISQDPITYALNLSAARRSS